MMQGNDGRVMTGGEAIVTALIANGIDTVYGLPGAQMYPFFDALQRENARIATIGARHEQACGYMAFGHARSTGRPGVFSVVPGPGLLNTMAALCTAAGCNAPVLCVTGQVPSAFLGRGRGHLHELPDQLATLRTVVKWAARIERPADAPAAIDEAFRQMLSGRPGPVAVEMAWDVMASSEFVRPLGPAAIPEPVPPLPEAIERVAEVLSGARRPMIMLGSGAQHAAAEVRALAELVGAPVTALRGGRGILPEDHALSLSSYAAFKLWPETDVVVGIGTRMELAYMRWTGMARMIDAPEAPPHLIRIDIDPAEMRRLRAHTAVVADAVAGTRALTEAVRARRTAPPADPAPIAAVRQAAEAETASVKPHVDYLAAIREVLPRDGFLVEELCQAGFASYFAWKALAPRTYVSAGYQGTLGFGFQTALGVKVANPDRAVVSITGDGGFLFGLQELATAAQYGIGVVTVLFNNNAYGNVLRDQQTGFQGREIGSRLTNPDFMALAGAFGVAAIRVDSPEALKRGLRDALSRSEPTLIEVTIAEGSEVSPWPFIHPSR